MGQARSARNGVCPAPRHWREILMVLCIVALFSLMLVVLT